MVFADTAYPGLKTKAASNFSRDKRKKNIGIMNSQARSIDFMRKDALAVLKAGIRAVEPGVAVKRYCRMEGDRLHVGQKAYNLSKIHRIYVIGVGKASASMAAAIEDILYEKITLGVVVTKYGHAVDTRKIRIMEAGHPVPDANGLNGSGEVFRLAETAEENDLVICLISGGGSALLPLPVEPISLKDKQETIRILLSCGASIHEINAVRKHISRIKGGRLAAAVFPGKLISLMLSDVVGDDMNVIASGPTVPDTSMFKDCIMVLKKYNIEKKLPGNVVDHIQSGVSGKTDDTPKASERFFENTQNMIIADNITALRAAEKEARGLGYESMILSSLIQGETRYIAGMHAAVALEIFRSGIPLKTPACVISGGETTVTVKGSGKGGRNQELALAAVNDIAGKKNIVILSCGTDGTDGDTDAAGAVSDSYTWERALDLGMNPEQFMENNDSYHFFERLGDLIRTGPTLTNVMDLRIMLIASQEFFVRI